MLFPRIFIYFAAIAVCFAQNRDSDFARLADRYLDEAVYRYDPASGTGAGFHQYDNLLALESHAEVQAQIAALKKFEKEVAAFPAAGLSPTAAVDRSLVLGQIRSQLLSLETLRLWEKN